MATKQSEENDLDFSDNDDVDNKPSKPVIAHKAMRLETEHPSPSNEKEVSKEENLEPISPASEENNFDQISPPESPQDSPASSNNAVKNFEKISDDETETEKNTNNLNDDEKDENKKEELNESDDKSNISDISNEQEPSENVDDGVKKESTKTNDKNNKTEDYIDAPVPSPFSDIGDVEDMGTGTDNELISDIMKDSNEADFTIESKESDNGPNNETNNKSTEVVEKSNQKKVTGEQIKEDETISSEPVLSEDVDAGPSICQGSVIFYWAGEGGREQKLSDLAYITTIIAYFVILIYKYNKRKRVSSS